MITKLLFGKKNKGKGKNKKKKVTPKKVTESKTLPIKNTNEGESVDLLKKDGETGEDLVPELSEKELLFIARAEKLKERRKGAKDGGNEQIQKLIDGALIKRNIAKAQLDRMTMKSGIMSAKSARKQKQAEIDKMDEGINRLLDISASIMNKDKNKLSDGNITRLLSLATSFSSVKKNKGAIDEIIDRALMKELEIQGGKNLPDDEAKEELKKLKEENKDPVEREPLEELETSILKKLSEFDGDPSVAPLIAERNRMQREHDQMKYVGYTYHKRKDMLEKIAKMEKRVEAARQEAFILKYAFPDVKEGEVNEDRDKHVAELSRITDYHKRKDDEVKQKAENKKLKEEENKKKEEEKKKKDEEKKKKTGEKTDKKVEKSNEKKEDNKKEPEKKKDKKVKKEDTKEKKEEKKEEKTAEKKVTEKLDSKEDIGVISKAHEKKFRHTLAVQMGFLKASDSLESLDKDTKEKLELLVDKIVSRPGKRKQAQISPQKITEKIEDLDVLREKAVEGGGYKDEIERLTTKLRIEQTEFDKMNTGGNWKAFKKSGPKDTKRRRIEWLQSRLNALINASMVITNKDAHEDDVKKVKKKADNIVKKRFGHQGKSIERLNKTARYNTAVQLGFIKQGEPLGEKTKLKVKKVIGLQLEKSPSQGVELLAKNVQEGIGKVEDTDEIKALLKKYHDLHAKRENKKKEYFEIHTRASINTEAEELGKKIQMLRRAQYAKNLDSAGKDDKFDEIQKKRDEYIKKKPSDTDTKQNIKAFDTELAKIDEERDKEVTKRLAVKMGVVKPDQKELKKDTIKRFDKVVAFGYKHADLNIKSDINMKAIKEKAAQHLKDREETLKKIEAGEHGDDPLLKRIFDKYRRALVRRRSAQLNLDRLKQELDPIEAKKLSGPKHHYKSRVKDMDLRLRHLIDCATTVMRTRAIEAKQAQEQKDKPELPTNTVNPNIEQVKKEEDHTPVMTLALLNKEKTGEKLIFHSMAVNMGYIKHNEKLPAHVEKQMKLITKQAKLAVVDSETIQTMGSKMADKYEGVGEGDEILTALLAEKKKCFDKQVELEEKEGKHDKEISRLENKGKDLEKQIRERRRILAVEKYGFEGDDEGREQFSKMIKNRDKTQKEKDDNVKSGKTDEKTIKPLNKNLKTLDKDIEAVVLKKTAKMLGLDVGDTVLEDGDRDRIKEAIKMADHQAYIEIETKKFKKTKAYKRVVEKYNKGVYSEVLQKRIKNDELEHDTEVVGLELSEDIKKALSGLKISQTVTKTGTKGLKTFAPKNEPKPVGTVSKASGTDIAGGALHGVSGLLGAVVKGMKLYESVKLNSGRNTDMAIDILKAISGFSGTIKRLLRTTSTGFGDGTEGVSQNFLELGVPIVALVQNVAKITGGIVQMGQSYKAFCKTKADLKNYQEGYNAGDSENVDAFEMLTLLKASSKKTGIGAVFDTSAGFFAGAAYGFALSGVATAGVGAAIAGMCKTLSRFIRYSKKAYMILLKKKQDEKFIEGVLTEDEAQEYMQTDGFRSLKPEDQDVVIMQSYGAGKKKHFVNMMRILHAQEIKERIDNGTMREIDKRIMRTIGFKFDADDTHTLKEASVHEIAFKLGFSGTNWLDALRNVEEMKQAKREKKGAKKTKEVKKIGRKQAKKGFDYSVSPMNDAV